MPGQEMGETAVVSGFLPITPAHEVNAVSFCEHCEGQRFDRARVLRALRQVRRELRGRGTKVDAALARALDTVKALDIPHLEFEDDLGGHIVH